MDSPPKPRSNLPVILAVHLAEDGVSIYCDPVPLIDLHGVDPVIWAPALAAALQSVCRAHSACLVDEDSGKHPSLDEIYTRILEALPDALEDARAEEPDNFPGPPSTGGS